MDIKSKKYNDDNPKENDVEHDVAKYKMIDDNETLKDSNIIKPVKKFTKFVNAIAGKKARVVAILIACVSFFVMFMNLVDVINYENENLSYYNENFTESYEYQSVKNELYNLLCITGSVYFRNLDENEKFLKSDYLLNEYLKEVNKSSKRLYDYNQFYQIKKSYYKTYTDEQKPVIYSELFDYYVSFGDHSLTNMSPLKITSDPNYYLDELTKKNNYWYLRKNNDITYDTNKFNFDHDNVYNDNNFSEFESDYSEEYYNSNLFPIGWSGFDNYGRYISCYGVGETFLYDFNTSEAKNRYIVNGFQEHKLEADEKAEDFPEADFYMDDNGTVATTDLIYKDDYTFTFNDDSKLLVYICPKQEILSNIEASYMENYNNFKIAIIKTIVTGIITVLSLIYILIITGYSTENDGTKKKWKRTFFFGRIYVEFQILLATLSAVGVIFLIAITYNSREFFTNFLKISKNQSDIMFALLSMLVFAFFVGVLSGLISKIKSKTFFKDFMITRIFKAMLRKFKNLGIFTMYDKETFVRKLHIRDGIFLGVSFVFTIYVFSLFYQYRRYSVSMFYYNMSLVFLIAYIIYAIWFVVTQFKLFKEMNIFDKQIDKVSKGEDAKSQLPETSLLYNNSLKLENLSENVKETVENQIKSERMKIELVTNVSHDLKTPLTSIISYIDLLKSEEMSDEAKDYVAILEQKSDKLKNIVSDVFSLAKATSGVDVEIVNLDVIILLNQVLADAYDKIENSGKHFKTEILSKSEMIDADGTKLYRVFQNLIDNAINYSMDSTRIFITQSVVNDEVVIEIKNIASYEMNFAPEEITERFNRGDTSRTDGGTGLGLSIAKSFTEACGGRFIIELDGDVFKVRVYFKITNRDIKIENIENTENN